MPACVRQWAHDCVHANAHGPMRLRAIGKWCRGSVYSTRPRHHLPLSQSVQPLCELRRPLVLSHRLVGLARGPAESGACSAGGDGDGRAVGGWGCGRAAMAQAVQAQAENTKRRAEAQARVGPGTSQDSRPYMQVRLSSHRIASHRVASHRLMALSPLPVHPPPPPPPIPLGLRM
jgi:hypothetical protein